MGFQTGLSGLNASSKNLDVIGHNVANSATVGFKASQAQFADVFAVSLSGGGGAQVGIGTRLSSVAQQFTQGNITATNNPLDMAINGRGFFRLSDAGAVSYTRNGQFQLDKDNFIVTSSNLNLTGYQADSVGTITGALGNLQLNTADIDPTISSKVSIGANLDSRMTAPVAPLTAGTLSGTAPNYNAPNPASYNSSTSLSIYDSLGNAHVATYYFVKQPAAGDWKVLMTIDNGVNNLGEITDLTPTQPAQAVAGMSWAGGVVTANVVAHGYAVGDKVTISGETPAGYNGTYTVASVVDADNFTYALATNPGAETVQGTATLNYDLLFDTSGKLVAPVGPPIGTIVGNSINWDPAMNLGISTPQALGFNFLGTTQFGSNFGVNTMSQDGYTSGRMAGFSIGGDGTVQGRYTNGQTRTLGQVALANFANPQGLQQMGDNQWTESAGSGSPVVGAPGTASLGLLQSSSTEDSNTDLTAELVNMIVAQRAYQANAQTIKTQDAIQQTLMNLR